MCHGISSSTTMSRPKPSSAGRSMPRRCTRPGTARRIFLVGTEKDTPPPARRGGGGGGRGVCEHYLKRLSQRGGGRFSLLSADAGAGRARIRVEHSVFVLAQGIAGVPVRHDKLCYAFAGWFSGAMDWVLESGGWAVRTTCAEDRCAAQAPAADAAAADAAPRDCIFDVHPLEEGPRHAVPASV